MEGDDKNEGSYLEEGRGEDVKGENDAREMERRRGNEGERKRVSRRR